MSNRYSIQEKLSYIGSEGQKKISSAHVAIVGCGALGGNLATFMTRIGTGALTLIDYDFPEESNLPRQPLYTEDDVKNQIPKVKAAEMKLCSINSACKISAHNTKLTFENAERLLGNADLILDGTDNLTARHIINEVSIKKSIPWIYGGVSGTVGMTMNIVPGKTCCFSCIFPDFSPEFAPYYPKDIGIIATLPALVASIQATEALKILLETNDYHNKLKYFDIWTHQITQIHVTRDPACTVCQKKKFRFLET
ncbi:ThiF family adenylyltransferase [Myxococcota bacterium]|nr:ThiF family adenylyltransferase [Myxococcota bacterium]MBU1383094.1 ThiF family adenylyltransferase [Myxococcota bacterium]MBU1497968.1 ThiF family adenylyltransferase [Myxococcota bacterium]